MLEVQLAEPVDVEQGDAQRAPVAVRPGHIELELGPERAQAQEGPRDGVAMLQARQRRLELGDALPGRGELLREAVSVANSQIALTIGFGTRTLKSGTACADA